MDQKSQYIYKSFYMLCLDLFILYIYVFYKSTTELTFLNPRITTHLLINNNTLIRYIIIFFLVCELFTFKDI